MPVSKTICSNSRARRSKLMKTRPEKTKRIRMKILTVASALIVGTMAPPVMAQPSEGLTISQNEEVTLTDLRDLGLIIMQIKQQAENIYMEATRKPVHISARPEIEDVKIITTEPMKARGKYLPTRPEWLTFYVGTMEPIIHLFQVNVGSSKDAAAKKKECIKVPRSTRDKFEKLLDTYDKGVADMNRYLSKIYDNISEKDNNITIAGAAVDLYKTAERIETARVSAFKLIKEAKDKTDLVKIER